MVIGENVFFACIIRFPQKKINSQSLSLRVDTDLEQLIEFSDNKKIGDFAVWKLEKWHQRLLQKHKGNFGSAADSVIIDGKEYF